MGGQLGRNERVVTGMGPRADRIDTISFNRWVEEMLPSLAGREMRMLFTYQIVGSLFPGISENIR